MMTKLVTKVCESMTGRCNGNSGGHVQGGGQLDLAGWVPVDDSIQVWRPVLESAWHVLARVSASIILFPFHCYQVCVIQY